MPNTLGGNFFEYNYSALPYGLTNPSTQLAASPDRPAGYGDIETPERRFEAAETLFHSGHSFTPADMRVTIRTPLAGEPILLGTLATLSFSSHRDKFPVVSLGRRGVKGFTYGHRTIAGSLAFLTLDTDAFVRLSREFAQAIGWARTSQYILADELPPFDVIATLVNEEGQSSTFSLFGVTVLDFGSSYTIDQIQVMESYSFMARSISMPRSMPELAGRGGTALDLPPFTPTLRGALAKEIDDQLAAGQAAQDARDRGTPNNVYESNINQLPSNLLWKPTLTPSESYDEQQRSIEDYVNRMRASVIDAQGQIDQDALARQILYLNQLLDFYNQNASANWDYLERLNRALGMLEGLQDES
jgi:hypothetical protein